VKNDCPSVLVLAGQRSGCVDPLAREARVTHKCLVPVLGQSLIGRVLATLAAALPHSAILVSVEDATVLESEPEVARLQNEGRLCIVKAEDNLVDSVRAAAAVAGFPLLITTADNVLVTPDALQRLASEGEMDSAADAILVLARKQDIEAAHSGGKGRYYEFRDGGYSNCNLFWLGGERALLAAEAFRGGGQFLKVAGRMLKSFGPVNLLLFRTKMLTVEQALRAVSKRLGARVRPLVLNDGRLAIDVDDERSMEMVKDILQRSEAPSPTNPTD
jgi:GTP:adenosylcobinamide-phosphate guanylyltransferase